MHWIVVEDASGNKESAEAWTKIIYGGQLNGIHDFEILLESSSAAYRTKFQRGFTVYIYRGTTLELTGTIIKISNTSTGLMRIRGMGYCDRQLDKPNAPSTTWTGQDNTTIVTAIMAKVSGVTEGSIAAYSGNPIASFRAGVNETCLQAIKRVNERTGQDWSFDYVNNELDIEDHKGSASSITTLNEGVDISGVTDTGDDINKILKVTVIGKNEGGRQISATKTHGSYAQGDNEISLVDKSIDTNAEAQLRADLEYAARVDTAQSVQFTVDNPGLSFVLGDVITINSASTGTDADRRITSFKRVIVPDQELLRLETRGTGERESSTDRLRELALEKRSIRDANVLKQGTDDSTASISTSGGVTSAPSITGVTGAVTDKPSITGVTGAVSAFPLTIHRGNDSKTGRTLAIGWNNNELSLAISGSYDWLYMWIRMYANTAGARDIGCRMHYAGTYFFSRIINNANPAINTYMIREYAFFYLGGSSTNTIYLDFYSGANVSYNLNLNVYSTPMTHNHGDTFDTSDSNHPHTDSFDTSDSNHPHADTLASSDSGHYH